jgi:uncharacterized protein (TIGR01777 family)
MDVMLTGGTGFIGSRLAARLLQAGHRVTVLTRKHTENKGDLTCLHGDPARPGPWQEAVGRQDAVINLAGATIFHRWTKKHRERMRSSRIGTTRNLVEALSAKTALISASAVGVFGSRGDELLDESASPGDDFLARLVLDWEAEARRGEGRASRVVIARLGIVLDRRQGALRQMMLPFRLFAGGRVGSGRQWLSWVHIEDTLGAFEHLLGDGGLPGFSGTFHITSPNPLQNKEFARILGRILRRPAWLPVPGLALKATYGELASVLLGGQRVVPRRLLESGYSFQFNDVQAALADLLKKPS